VSKRAIIDQLKQPSTWRGIVILGSSLGYALTPDLGEAIIAVGLAVSGLIGILAGSDTPPPAAS
jgi:hypothetical protein